MAVMVPFLIVFVHDARTPATNQLYGLRRHLFSVLREQKGSSVYRLKRWMLGTTANGVY